MSSTFSLRHVVSACLLQKVNPAVLYRLLQKYEAFFSAADVMPATPTRIDYDRLSLLLAAPGEQMPAHLMADLFYWDEVAHMGQIEDLNEIAETRQIEFGAQVTLEEAALLVRLEAPEDLEDLHAVYHAHGLLRKKKRFLSYFAVAAELPPWRKPTQEALQRFSNHMDLWYERQKKGRGTRVSVIEKGDAAWFIIRHGGTFKRENALENGEPRLVFFRPEAYDLLIYYHRQGELAIYNDGNSTKERRAYCTYLGMSLFDNNNFFESGDGRKYTLEPLRRRGRAAMDCTAIPGLRSARLTYLRYRFNGGNNHNVTHRAEDVFGGLEDLSEPIPENAELVSMGVKLTPDHDVGGERNVKLYAPNISVYDHEADAELAHRFLLNQGFIIPRNGSAAV